MACPVAHLSSVPSWLLISPSTSGAALGTAARHGRHVSWPAGPWYPPFNTCCCGWAEMSAASSRGDCWKMQPQGGGGRLAPGSGLRCVPGGPPHNPTPRSRGRQPWALCTLHASRSFPGGFRGLRQVLRREVSLLEPGRADKCGNEVLAADCMGEG